MPPLIGRFVPLLTRHWAKRSRLSAFHHQGSAALGGGAVRCLGILGFSKPSEWSKVVSDAERIVGYPTSFLSLRCLLSDELSNVALQMRKLVGTRHPLLRTAKDMIHDGKHGLQTRGLIVLLLSKAAGHAPGTDPIDHDSVSGICPSQRSLAEITEIIHTASRIHQGVVNMADLTPADGPPADMEFGNKMAVLSGDFLLASACTGLADLGNTHVVELMAGSIGDLMEAEFTGFTDRQGAAVLPEGAVFDDWHRQTYLASGSLLARSCRAAMELGGHDNDLQDSAHKYGLSMAYLQQLSDDIGAVTRGDNSEIRVTSAPVVKLQEREPEVRSLLEDKVNVKELLQRLTDSGVLSECRDLCDHYSTAAIAALDALRPSDAKVALTNLVHAVRRS